MDTIYSHSYLNGCDACFEETHEALSTECRLDDRSPKWGHLLGPVCSLDALKPIGFEELLIVVDGAPLRQVVGFADAIQQSLLIVFELGLSSLEVSAAASACKM